MKNSNKQTIGFTLGCFDVLHIGHINLLKNAKSLCDKLIVGVCSDEYIKRNKGGGVRSFFSK